jgi:hypothetical protein
MATIKEQVEVHCPYVRALHYVDAYLAHLGWSEHARSVMLRLRVPVGPRVGVQGLALDKGVIATLSRSPKHHALEDRIGVTWQPDVDGEPFPRFDGALSLEAATPKASILTLAGKYEPPLGGAGKLFDAALGHRIAQATARELLKEIADRIELGFAQDEPHLSR